MKKQRRIDNNSEVVKNESISQGHELVKNTISEEYDARDINQWFSTQRKHSLRLVRQIAG